MKVLLSWLREFVDVPGTVDQIAARLSVRGFAVESIEPWGDDDAVIDFEVTANRPDCLSIAGMAREVATAFDLRMRTAGSVSPSTQRSPGLASPADSGSAESAGPRTGLTPVERSEIDVVIETPELCSRYAGAVADVRVAPSPDWMQARLRAAGVRPISNIVDVTNYVLIELGQPMHAFDFAVLRRAQIRIRTAGTGETLRTLDGEMRTLSPEMLVIADGERPVAIAGVMGGSESEVTEGTTTIVLESASFNPWSVRRTSKALGLKTEASMRFERGVDPHLPVIAMERACALLAITGAGGARGTVVDRHPVMREPVVLRLRRHRLAALLGSSPPDVDVLRILTSLGFSVEDAPDGWDVTVPSCRVDVHREVDLIEEVARHHGFDRLPVTFPTLTTPPPPIDPRITQARELRAAMTGAGFSEAVTFGFIPAAAAAAFAGDDDIVPIANPLSETFAVLRPSVLPGLIEAVSHNRRRERRDVRLFEIGARFSRTDGERRVIACAWTGAAGGDHWSGPNRDVDFFDLKGACDRICQVLRLRPRVLPADAGWLVAGRSAVALIDDTRIGLFGELAPHVGERHGLPPGDAVYVLEIDLDAAAPWPAAGELIVEPLPRYPSVLRDISILVPDTLPAADVRRTIQHVAPPILVSIREFDRYQGKGIPQGQVSLSIRLTFRSPERTLTDAEVQQATETVIGALRDRHGAVQR
jgi:phenylalanyl-tRNA synthetase beta chain